MSRPCSAWLRAAPAGLPQRAGGAASAGGTAGPPAGVLAIGAGPAAAAAGGEVLAVPQNLREPWAEQVAIMVTDRGLPREEAERLAWEWLQAPGEAR